MGVGSSKKKKKDSFLKLVMLGSPKAGKSTLALRLVTGEYCPAGSGDTIEDWYTKQIEVDEGVHKKIEIYDSTSTEPFTAMRDLHMKNGDGFVVVYSIKRRQSFDDVADIIEQILRVRDSEWAPIILVGTFSDQEESRMVDQEKVEKLVQRYRLKHQEVSCLTGENVENTFHILIRAVEDGYFREELNIKRACQNK